VFRESGTVVRPLLKSVSGSYSRSRIFNVAGPLLFPSSAQVGTQIFFRGGAVKIILKQIYSNSFNAKRITKLHTCHLTKIVY
jgi:hypothetical protein